MIDENAPVDDYGGYSHDVGTPFYEEPIEDISVIATKRKASKSSLKKVRRETVDYEDIQHVRKSKRLKCSPLAFWRNEKVIYSRKNSAGIDAHALTPDNLECQRLSML